MWLTWPTSVDQYLYMNVPFFRVVVNPRCQPKYSVMSCPYVSDMGHTPTMNISWWWIYQTRAFSFSARFFSWHLACVLVLQQRRLYFYIYRLPDLSFIAWCNSLQWPLRERGSSRSEGIVMPRLWCYMYARVQNFEAKMNWLAWCAWHEVKACFISSQQESIILALLFFALQGHGLIRWGTWCLVLRLGISASL